MNVDYDHFVKLLIIGDLRVGKTNLLFRFVDDTYCEYYYKWCTVDFRIHTVNLDGKVIKLQIWDTPISLRFRTIRNVMKSYFRGMHGVIMVYDVTDQDTFSNINQWLQEIETYCMPNVCKLLVGNKCDMTSERRVDYSTAKEYADEMKINFIETSAKSGTNVEQAFLTIVCDIKRKLFDNKENCNTIDITSSKTVVKEPGSSLGDKTNTHCCRCF